MNDLNLPDFLYEKLYQIVKNSDQKTSKIVSYFPLIDEEKKILERRLNLSKEFKGFFSIFSDFITETEWNENKISIKKRFVDELIKLD